MVRKYATINGRRVPVTVLGWRTLKRTTTGASTQDSGGNSIWEWVWKYTAETGQFLGFESRRQREASTKWYIMKDTTSEIDDQAKLRLVVYHPDGETMECILLDETYGTLKNASRYDIQNLIGPNKTKVLRPGHVVQLEVNHSDTLDISQCEFEIGHKLMSQG